MVRFGAACGSGLGSSFMVEMNIQSILRELGVSDKVTVQHYDLSSASPGEADVWFVGQDLENSAGHLGDVRFLKSIIDMNELREKVTQACKDTGLIA